MMKKYITGLVLLLSVVCTASAQKYALIDTEYILKNIPAYEQANRQLEEQSRKYQTQVEALAKEAQSLFQDYQSKAENLSQTERTKREEAIVEKEKKAAELKRNYFGPEGELVKMRQRLISPIQDQVYEAVKSVATRHHYYMVLDRATAAGIIFADPQIDISDEVLAALGYSN